MNFERIKVLLVKYFDDSLDESERLELDERLNSISDKELHKLLSEVDTPLQDDLAVPAENMERRLQHALDRLLEDQHFYDLSPEIPEIKKATSHRHLWRLFAAAAILLVVTFGYYFQKSASKQDELIALDLEPARSLATITLDNGDIIQVDSGVVGLVYEKDGVQIFKDEKGEIVYSGIAHTGEKPVFLTVNTPKGGTSKVKLADGTLIGLNAASSVRYPVIFSDTLREVFVEGEAFFEVAHDRSKPFKVHSNKQTVEVLGTSFNIVSQPNYAKTTLLEGSVKLIIGDKNYLLKPGEEATVTETVQIKQAKVAESIAWKNEEFVFDNSTLYETLQEIENWYNVKMVFADRNVENVKLSGSVSRRVKLSALLKVLEMNTDYTFKIEGRRVIVDKH